MDNNYIQHHGVPGMKWGVRRYQNKDGSLTPAGKKRYDPPPEGIRAKLKRKSAAKAEAKKAANMSKRKISDLSSDELQEKIKRLEMEKKYKDLMKQTRAPESKKGKEFVTGILEKSAKNIGEQLVTYLMGEGVNLAAKKLFDAKGNVVNPKKGQKDK